MIAFDEPKVATGGSGNGLRPPDKQRFAQPGNVPGPQPKAPQTRAAPSGPVMAPRNMAPVGDALQRKRLRNIERRTPKHRMAAALAKFRADVAAFEAAQPGYDPCVIAQREHESKIRRAFRALHHKGTES